MKSRRQMKEEEERAVAEMEKKGGFKGNLDDWVRNEYNEGLKEESKKAMAADAIGQPHEHI